MSRKCGWISGRFRRKTPMEYTPYRYRRKLKRSKIPLTLDDLDKILTANIAYMFRKDRECGNASYSAR